MDDCVPLKSFEPEKCRHRPKHDTIFYGFRTDSHGKRKKQRYCCKDCPGTFVRDDDAFHKKYPLDVILLAKKLHSEGRSLREIRGIIHEKKGIWINHVTISLWIRPRKYLKKSSRKKVPSQEKIQLILEKIQEETCSES